MTDALLLPGTDPLSVSLWAAERLIASSSTFQTLVGAADFASAKAKIEYKEADGNEARPYACFSLVNPLRYQQNAGGDQNYLRPAGEVWLYIAADPPAEVLAADQPKKAELMWASKTFGAIVAEMAAVAGADQTIDADQTDSHLPVSNVTVLDFSCVPEERWPSFGHFWWAVISLQWGDEG